MLYVVATEAPHGVGTALLSRWRSGADFEAVHLNNLQTADAIATQSLGYALSGVIIPDEGTRRSSTSSPFGKALSLKFAWCLQRIPVRAARSTRSFGGYLSQERQD